MIIPRNVRLVGAGNGSDPLSNTILRPQLTRAPVIDITGTLEVSLERLRVTVQPSPRQRGRREMRHWPSRSARSRTIICGGSAGGGGLHVDNAKATLTNTQITANSSVGGGWGHSRQRRQSRDPGRAQPGDQQRRSPPGSSPAGAFSTLAAPSSCPARSTCPTTTPTTAASAPTVASTTVQGPSAPRPSEDGRRPTADGSTRPGTKPAVAARARAVRLGDAGSGSLTAQSPLPGWRPSTTWSLPCREGKPPRIVRTYTWHPSLTDRRTVVVP